MIGRRGTLCTCRVLEQDVQSVVTRSTGPGGGSPPSWARGSALPWPWYGTSRRQEASEEPTAHRTSYSRWPREDRKFNRLLGAVCLVVAAVVPLVGCGDRTPTSATGGSAPPWAHVSDLQRAFAARVGSPVAFEHKSGVRFVVIPPREPSDGGSLASAQRVLYMATHETSVAAFDRFLSSTPSMARPVRWATDNLPITEVTFDEAAAFAAWLGDTDPGRTYRLPSESEWEWACLAGTVPTDVAPEFAPGAPIPAYDRRRNSPFEVGSQPANAWGLHEMAGGVWEICSDVFRENGQVIPVEGGERARTLRGGSWKDPKPPSAYYRFPLLPPNRRAFDAGFRVVAETARELTSHDRRK